MLTSIKNKIKDVSLAVAAFLLSAPVLATETSSSGGGGLVDLAERGVGAVNAFNQLALGAFYLAGVVVFGMGCYLIYKEQGESGRGHGKKGVVGILIGGALLAMPSMIGLTQETLTNEDKTGSACVGGNGGTGCSY